MSSSSSESESGDEHILDNSTDEDDQTLDYGENGFSFEPEHSEEVVQALLSQHVPDQQGDDVDFLTDNEILTVDDWCSCESCTEMENDFERVCCRGDAEQIIGNKFGDERCISHTEAFRDVCLNTNVLEAAIGTWRTFSDEPLQINNRSYRFIAYRQYISWIFKWLGRDIRKIIPSCVVQKIRQNFPAQDGVYVPFQDA